MDFLLLQIVRLVTKWKSKLLKIIFASVIGAACTCIFAVVPGLYGIIKFITMYLFICGIMIRVAFQTRNVKALMKGMLLLYSITFFLGGVIQSFSYQTKLITYLKKVVNKNLFQKVTLFHVMSMTFIAVLLFLIFYVILNHIRESSKTIYEVKVQYDKKEIHTYGLYDTGNLLIDPMTGKPVIVIEYEIIKNILSEDIVHCIENSHIYNYDFQLLKSENYTKFKLIPYQSIGNQKGLMPAIVLDQIEIAKVTEVIMHKKVVAAVSKEDLSTRNDYHIILHKNIC